MTTSKLRIALPKRFDHLCALHNVVVPGPVYAQAPFFFAPPPFGIGNERLKDRIISEAVQENSLDGFLEDPTAPSLYVAASEPDGGAASLFAAFLLSHYLKSVRNCRPIWHRMHQHTQELVRNEVPCSFLIVSGVYPTMTPYRMERLRDLLEYYDSIPRIVVLSGEDPLTFCYTKLHLKPTHIFFKPAGGFKKKVEVV